MYFCYSRQDPSPTESTIINTYVFKLLKKRCPTIKSAIINKQKDKNRTNLKSDACREIVSD